MIFYTIENITIENYIKLIDLQNLKYSNIFHLRLPFSAYFVRKLNKDVDVVFHLERNKKRLGKGFSQLRLKLRWTEMHLVYLGLKSNWQDFACDGFKKLFGREPKVESAFKTLEMNMKKIEHKLQRLNEDVEVEESEMTTGAYVARIEEVLGRTIDLQKPLFLLKNDIDEFNRKLKQ